MSALEWSKHFEDKRTRAEEASSRAKILKNQAQASDVELQNKETQSEALSIMGEQLKQANTELKRMQGNSTKQFANEYIAASTREEAVAGLDRWVANESPETLKALDIKNPATVGMLSGDKDRQLLKSYISQTYGMDTEVPDETWDTIMDSGMFVKADGTIKDMSIFTKMSGAYKQMTKEQRSVFDSKEESIVSEFNRLQAEAEIKAKAEEKLQSEKVSTMAAQLAGTGQAPKPTDTRSTMGKELDDLSARFPDLSEDEIYSKWKESKEAGKSSGTMPWDERLIDRKRGELSKKGLKPGDKEYDSTISSLFKDIETKTLYGAAENRSQQDESVAQASINIGNTILDSIKPDGTYQVGSLALETQLKNSPVYSKDIKPLMKEFDADELALKEAFNVRRDLNNFIDGGGDMGKLESVWKDLSSVTPDDLAGMATLSTSELQDRYKIDGGQAVLVGKIVKSLYGSAASNVEGQSIRDHLAITSWSNATSAKAKVNSLVNLADRQFVEKGNKLISKGMTYSVPNSLNSVKKLREEGKVPADKLAKYKAFYDALSDADKARYKNPKDL